MHKLNWLRLSGEAAGRTYKDYDNSNIQLTTMPTFADKMYQGMVMLVTIAMTARAQESCGVPAVSPQMEPWKASNNRIVNGWEVKPHSLPWMVFIAVAQGNESFFYCSGFLVGYGRDNETDIVLTAAHCVYDADKYKLPHEIVVFAGAHDLNDPNDMLQKRRVQKYATTSFHPVSYDNDIVLLVLNKPVTYGPHISPLCLPRGSMRNMENFACYVAGWGKTEHGTLSTKLKTTRMLIVPDHMCATVENQHKQMCVGQYYAGYSTCNGDSGSPLFCEIDGRYYAVGILSLGAANCTQNVAARYVRMTAYVGWLRMSYFRLLLTPRHVYHIADETSYFLPSKIGRPGPLLAGASQESLDSKMFLAHFSEYNRPSYRTKE